MKKEHVKIITILSILLAVSLAIVSYFGAFVSSTYARDSASMGAQGIGQDIVDLFFVVPLLLVSLYFARKNNRAGILILAGTLFYIMYSFIIYAFGVHFNQLFLLYCSTLGLSLFAFLVLVSGLQNQNVQLWFKKSKLDNIIGIYFIVIAVMFYMLWLKDVVPSIIHNTVPETVSNYNLLVNPVHVIDMAFALPGLIITAFLLFKRQHLGYILAAVGLVFTIILTVALAGMVIMLKVKEVSDDVSVAGIFIVLSIISTVLLVLFLMHLRKERDCPKSL
ncbi:MAG: hypothetical protein KQH79_05040 [Bacteroidetes bacterium]|nr:hypothetical protein [Bacteroidota bacterium]